MNIKKQVEAIRAQLDRADGDTHAIGHILIALSALTDIVEVLSAQKEAAPEPDRYAAARHEYQAERRIDEYAAWQREQDNDYN